MCTWENIDKQFHHLQNCLWLMLEMVSFINTYKFIIVIFCIGLGPPCSVLLKSQLLSLFGELIGSSF